MSTSKEFDKAMNEIIAAWDSTHDKCGNLIDNPTTPVEAEANLANKLLAIETNPYVYFTSDPNEDKIINAKIECILSSQPFDSYGRLMAYVICFKGKDETHGFMMNIKYNDKAKPYDNQARIKAAIICYFLEKNLIDCNTNFYGLNLVDLLNLGYYVGRENSDLYELGHFRHYTDAFIEMLSTLLKLQPRFQDNGNDLNKPKVKQPQ